MSLQGNPYGGYPSRFWQAAITLSGLFRGAEAASPPRRYCVSLWAPVLMAAIRICVATQTNAYRGDGVPNIQNMGSIAASRTACCNNLCQKSAALRRWAQASYCLSPFPNGSRATVRNPLHFPAANQHPSRPTVILPMSCTLVTIANTPFRHSRMARTARDTDRLTMPLPSERLKPT